MSSENSRGATALAPFEYRRTDAEDDGVFGAANDPATGETRRNEVLAQAEKRGYQAGFREGQNQAKAACEQELSAIRSGMTTAVAQFKSERQAYFRRAEPEIVQLALAIARKILHREAQMDPLLLTGVVHVALERMDAGSHIRLRAHPDDVGRWLESFSAWQTSAAPEIIGDSGLQPGECALETALGSTQLSLDNQLKEIEQGFMDLLEQRPVVR